VPPEMIVPELATPPATPPEAMFSMPPLKTVTLLVVMPATLSVPPFETAMSCTVPPEDTFRAAPENTVA
jgi:hypothetical protein